jgi:predicted kinase
MDSKGISADEALVRSDLGRLPEPGVSPPFVVVSGLPGTGKSHFARSLAARLPFVIVGSDSIRKRLVRFPEYTPTENTRVFSVCHRLIEDLLKEGIPVIFDATNLSEHSREILYHISKMSDARLFLISIEATPQIVSERLRLRKTGANPADKSDADWSVYTRLRGTRQKIGRSHFVVDTSGDIAPALQRLVREITKSG